MHQEVRSSQFTDEQLKTFLDGIQRVFWTSARESKLTDWLRDQANTFADSLPRPTIDEFRLHIDRSVAVARGWDDPEDTKIMVHSALKSFYLVAWIEHLHRTAPELNPQTLMAAVAIAFTPVFHSAATDM